MPLVIVETVILQLTFVVVAEYVDSSTKLDCTLKREVGRIPSSRVVEDDVEIYNIEILELAKQFGYAVSANNIVGIRPDLGKIYTRGYTSHFADRD